MCLVQMDDWWLPDIPSLEEIGLLYVCSSQVSPPIRKGVASTQADMLMGLQCMRSPVCWLVLMFPAPWHSHL